VLSVWAPSLLALFLGSCLHLCGRVCDGFRSVFRKLNGHSLLFNTKYVFLFLSYSNIVFALLEKTSLFILNK
jgi:hypothetical protein